MWHLLCDGVPSPVQTGRGRQGVCEGLRCSFRGCWESLPSVHREHSRRRLCPRRANSVLSQSSDEHSGWASASPPSPPCLFPEPEAALGQLSVGGTCVSNLNPGELRAGGVWAEGVEASRWGGGVAVSVAWRVSPRPLLLSRLWTLGSGRVSGQAWPAG